MARKREPIQTKSYVRIDGELVEVKDLPKEVWAPIARDLLCRYLNELYRGKAHFFYPENIDENYKGGNVYDADGTLLYPGG